MANLVERVAALEIRVDELSVEVRHATDLGVTASREALTARDAHQRNIELLNALRVTQAEHTQVLAEHGRRFDAIDRRFDAIDSRLESLDAVKGRLDVFESTLGRVTLGMHTIESLLRGLTDDA